MINRSDLKLIENLLIRFVAFYWFGNRHKLLKFNQHSSGIAKQIENSPYWSKHSEYHPTLQLLNSGDCALIALAVGEVLRLSGFTGIRYHCNGGHYYFSAMVRAYKPSPVSHYLGADTVNAATVNRQLFFDAFNLKGNEVESSLLGHNNPEVTKFRSGDAEWFAENALYDDHIGKEWVEQFVKFYFFDYTYPYAITDRESEFYQGDY